MIFTFICRLRVPFRANAKLHWGHLNGFSPVWIRLCLFNAPLLLNDFEHSSHLKGRSPVWVLRWICKWLGVKNIFIQISHSYFFSRTSPSSVCFLACCLRLSLRVKLLLHMSQVNFGASESQIFKCFSSCFGAEKFLLHCGQEFFWRSELVSLQFSVSCGTISLSLSSSVLTANLGMIGDAVLPTSVNNRGN